MADEPKLPAGNPGETGDTAPEDTSASAGHEDKTLLTGGDAAEGAGDAGATPPSWREDWRETLAAGDDKELARLKRFSTPENFARSYRELQKKLSSGQASGPPEGATDAEIAQFRKTAGIPEKADGYGLAFPDGVKATEADTAALTGFAEHMHAAHMTPAAAKAAFAFYAQRMAQAQEAQAEFVRNAEADARATLRAEWGPREFTRSLAISYQALEKFMGDKAPAVAGIRLADGRTLGKHEDFMRLLHAVGRATADEEALIGGDGAGGGKSLEDEKTELVNKSVSKGLSKTEDAKLDKIYEALAARDERNGRGRAA